MAAGGLGGIVGSLAGGAGGAGGGLKGAMETTMVEGMLSQAASESLFGEEERMKIDFERATGLWN